MHAPHDPLHFFFGLNWPIGIEDTTAVRRGNRLSQCEDWQFGLIVIRMAELAHRFFSTRSKLTGCVAVQPSQMRLAPKSLNRQLCTALADFDMSAFDTRGLGRSSFSRPATSCCPSNDRATGACRACRSEA